MNGAAPDRPGRGVSERLARLSLVLYPPSFRREFGAGMIEDIGRQARRAARSAGPIGRVTRTAHLVVALLWNGLALWKDELSRSGSPRPWGGDHRRPRRSALFSWLDLKLGLRMLLKHPGMTLIGGLGIAAGIGIGVGFFAFMQSYFFPVIPLDEADRLVALENWDTQIGNEDRRSIHDFVIWRDEMRSIEDMSAFRTVQRNLITADGAVTATDVAEITPSGFELARVPAALGRTLVESDGSRTAPPVAVIGHELWRTRFVGDPGIVGTEVRLGHTPYTIVGVMPEGYGFPLSHRFWVPLLEDPADHEVGAGPSIFISGRLAPGVSMQEAQAELDVIAARMASTYPETHQRFRAQVLPYHYPLIDINEAGPNAPIFEIMGMLATMCLLLLVVCVNVGILVYARTAARQSEIAVRSAMGASRGRIVSQIFIESLVLATGGAVVALGLMKLGLPYAHMIMEAEGITPFWQDYGLSGLSLVYMVVLTLLAAVLTGVVPALRATGTRSEQYLRSASVGGGARLGRTWSALVVGQVGFAVAALPIAVVLAWWQVRDSTTQVNFPADALVVGAIAPSSDAPPDVDVQVFEAAQLANWADVRDELYRRLEAEPGIIGVTLTAEGTPPEGQSARVEGDGPWASSEGDGIISVRASRVAPDFFELLDVDVRAGRVFGPAEGEPGAAPVVVVSEAFARRTAPDGNVLGRRIRFRAADGRPDDAAQPADWHEIVGVVGDLTANSFDPLLIDPHVYRPLPSDWSAFMQFVVRGNGMDSNAIAARFREITVELDPTMRFRTTTFDEAFQQERAAGTLVALMVALAVLSVLMLSTGGVYALTSFIVAKRRREIGIRTALGADQRQLLTGILGGALKQIAVGVALGVAAALIFDYAAGGQLLRGRALQLLSGMVVVMVLVGVFGVLGPARRGLRIEPTEALKAE